MNFTPALPGWTAHYYPNDHEPLAGWITYPNRIAAVIHDERGTLIPADSATDELCCITGPGQPPHTTTPDPNTHPQEPS